MNRAETYLDYAAATPLDERVVKAMRPYQIEQFYNPSSPYEPAVKVRRDYEDAKSSLARAIGGKGTELIMTAGATESINLAFQVAGGHIVTSAVEHQAILAASARPGTTIVSVDKRGRVNPGEVAAAIRPETELVSIGLVNSELGTIQPLREIAEIVRAKQRERLSRGDKRPIFLHSDASQGLGLLDVNVARLGVDMLTINAAKVYGPKQVGALWLSSRVAARPLVVGGGQERGLRSGTENVAGVVGFAKAVYLAEKSRRQEVERIRQLRDQAQRALLERWPEAVVSGDQKHRLVSFLHISFPKLDAERLIFKLETKQIYVATGSACAANQGTRSHVLEAIELGSELADGSLRLTFGRFSEEEQVMHAVDQINQIIAAEYERIEVKS